MNSILNKFTNLYEAIICGFDQVERILDLGHGAPGARSSKNVKKPPESNVWVMKKSLSADFCFKINKFLGLNHTFDSGVYLF